MKHRDTVMASTHLTGLVLLDCETGRVFSANHTGRFLWELLAATSSRDRLSASLAAAFSVAPSTADAHVDAFLADLTRHGLIDAAGAA